MKEQDKQELIQLITESTKLPQIEVETIVNSLSGLDALNMFWCAPNRKLKIGNTTVKVPEKFFMVSPLFKGMVTFVQREGWCGYEDENGNVRVQASNTNGLAKKIVKYAK